MSCRVSAAFPGDERRWFEVDASSLYIPIFAYNYEVVCRNVINRSLERGRAGMELAVIREDGRTFRGVRDAVMRSANRL